MELETGEYSCENFMLKLILRLYKDIKLICKKTTN